MKALFLFAACVLVLLLGSTSAEVAPESRIEKVSWGPVAGGCRLSAAADQSSYAIGQPVEISLTVENVGDQTISAVSTDLEHFQFKSVQLYYTR